MGKVNISEGRFLTKEKDLIVYRDQGGLEITIGLRKKRGLLVQIGEDAYGDLDVRVTRTTNGCTECRKPDFRKKYPR